MKRHLHNWKKVGYYSSGFGISSDNIIYWCIDCGALHKNKTVKPKKK